MFCWPILLDHYSILGQIGRIERGSHHIHGDCPNDIDEENIKGPALEASPKQRYPPIQHEQEECGYRPGYVNGIHFVVFSVMKSIA